MCLFNIREQNNYAEACKYGSKLGKHAEKKYPLCLCPWVKIIECPISFIKIPFEFIKLDNRRAKHHVSKNISATV